MDLATLFEAAQPPLPITEVVQSRMLHNPSVASILGLLKRSENGALRGLVSGQDVWWWDAELALHGDVAKNIGHSNYIDDRLNLYFDHGDVRLDIPDADDWNFATIMQQPQLARMLRSPLVYVSEPGHGLISGPEWIALNNELPRPSGVSRSGRGFDG